MQNVKVDENIKKSKIKNPTELTHFRLPISIKKDMIEIAEKLNYASLSQAIVLACAEWVKREKKRG